MPEYRDRRVAAAGPTSGEPGAPRSAARFVPGNVQAMLQLQHAAGNAAVVQRVAPTTAGAVDRPQSGINAMGFIDSDDGANIRTGPAESRGVALTPAPMPPATRVYVSGTHPKAAQWLYVTAFLGSTVVRGYVQDFRVTTKLPEPMARLHQVKSGDTAERLAVQEFKQSVRDGHDLRYYENVLLYVNREAGRAGVKGSYQDPGLLGGGANNVQLEAGRRIWLVSPTYAAALEKVVPDGSFTNGMYAKVKHFVQHVEDILQSVTDSPDYFGEVAGQYADAIREHRSEIIGIVIIFLTAEAASALLATSPTGVGQIIAALIQLVLAALGAAGMVQALAQAVKHGSQWLTLAWTANGNPKQVAEASREFIRMLVSVAMAALAWAGVKGNYATAVRIGNSIDMGGNAAFAMVGGGTSEAGGAGAAAATGGPNVAGPLGAGGAQMTKHGDGGGSGQEPPKDEPSAAERDWEKAEKEVRKQEAEQAQGGQTEHGALRQQERGSLSAAEESRLQSAVGHQQPDGAVTKVLKEKGGGYTVVTVNQQGQLVTVIRGRTPAELRNLSENYGWDPPWK